MACIHQSWDDLNSKCCFRWAAAECKGILANNFDSVVSTYIDNIFGCACSIVKHGVAIDVQVLYFTQRQQRFHHLNVALFDG